MTVDGAVKFVRAKPHKAAPDANAVDSIKLRTSRALGKTRGPRGPNCASMQELPCAGQTMLSQNGDATIFALAQPGAVRGSL